MYREEAKRGPQDEAGPLDREQWGGGLKLNWKSADGSAAVLHNRQCSEGCMMMMGAFDIT